MCRRWKGLEILGRKKRFLQACNKSILVQSKILNNWFTKQKCWYVTPSCKIGLQILHPTNYKKMRVAGESFLIFWIIKCNLLQACHKNRLANQNVLLSRCLRSHWKIGLQTVAWKLGCKLQGLQLAAFWYSWRVGGGYPGKNIKIWFFLVQNFCEILCF